MADIKELVNAPVCKASKNGQLPGRHYQHGISHAVGGKLYWKTMICQIIFLASIQMIGIQGLSEEIFDLMVGESGEIGTKILTSHQRRIAIEKT